MSNSKILVRFVCVCVRITDNHCWHLCNPITVVNDDSLYAELDVHPGPLREFLDPRVLRVRVQLGRPRRPRRSRLRRRKCSLKPLTTIWLSIPVSKDISDIELIMRGYLLRNSENLP